MSEYENKIHDPRKYWLDDPKNVNKLVCAVYGIVALLFLADFFYHKHPHYEAEYLPGFYGFFGFLAFVGVVLAGKALRKVIMRKEGYYDE